MTRTYARAFHVAAAAALMLAAGLSDTHAQDARGSRTGEPGFFDQIFGGSDRFGGNQAPSAAAPAQMTQMSPSELVLRTRPAGESGAPAHRLGRTAAVPQPAAGAAIAACGRGRRPAAARAATDGPANPAVGTADPAAAAVGTDRPERCAVRAGCCRAKRCPARRCPGCGCRPGPGAAADTGGRVRPQREPECARGPARARLAAERADRHHRRCGRGHQGRPAGRSPRRSPGRRAARSVDAVGAGRA